MCKLCTGWMDGYIRSGFVSKDDGAVQTDKQKPNLHIEPTHVLMKRNKGLINTIDVLGDTWPSKAIDKMIFFSMTENLYYKTEVFKLFSIKAQLLLPTSARKKILSKINCKHLNLRTLRK